MTLRKIEAYASTTSLFPGETIYFHVYMKETSDFDVDIRRIGLDEPIVYSTTSNNAGPYTTPSNAYEVGCGWPVAIELKIPDEWTSGVYIATFSYDSETAEVQFVVKASDLGATNKILFQSAVNTAQAYNNWGGKSLYDYNSSNGQRSYKVSFNRPLNIIGDNGGYNDFRRWEDAFIKWLEKNGYGVDYCTNIDIHADPSILDNYNLFVSVGHDEYWSGEMRDSIDNFRSNNGNLAFFSGNVCWWQIRFEAQDDVDNRLMVCYKNLDADETANPNIPDTKRTINWYEPLLERPENLSIGVSFIFGAAWTAENMPDEYYSTRLNKHWLFKDTNLLLDEQFGVYDHNSNHYQTIGYETDAADFSDFDKKFPIATGNLYKCMQGITAPKDFMVLASANLAHWADTPPNSSGSNNHNGFSTIGIFRAEDGGFGFTVGTTDWSVGLKPNVYFDDWNPTCQITKNVLDILGSTFEPQAFLIDNPDFEDWESGVPVGWYKEGTGNISQDSSPHSGEYCLKVDATNGHTWVSQNYIPIRTNKQYRVSCYAKGEIPNEMLSSGITIRLQTIDTDPYHDFITAEYTDIKGEWQLISAIGSQIENDNDYRMRHARVKIEVAAGTIGYFDEVLVEELP